MAPVAPATKTFTAPPSFAHCIALVWKSSFQTELEEPVRLEMTEQLNLVRADEV
jgi:hypothetical protein